MQQLIQRIRQGDRRAAARAITIIDNQSADRHELLKQLHPYRGTAYVIGITGAPGAGKSTLTDELLTVIRGFGLKAGVLAVDPTSPFTGGAILGDRVRMNQHAMDPGVFIRSMGTRGSLGGLAKSTKEAVQVLDAFGVDVVLIETVGVGQTELEIMHIADTTVVVLNPAAGDHIQTMKAGIMEIADVFVVNKADLPGADKTVNEVNAMLDLIHDFDWRPPVLKTAAGLHPSFTALWETCEQHRQFLHSSKQWDFKRQKQLQDDILQIVMDKLRLGFQQRLANDPYLGTLMRDAESGIQDPYSIADKIMEWYNTSTCD